MVPTKKMMHPRLVRRRGKYSKEAGYFDPKTCSQCIVVPAPYPSSLGGVYQPAGTGRQALSQGIPHPATFSPTCTHRSFHESARGICMTVVLWRDCTGSGKTSDDVIEAKRAPADKAMGSEVKDPGFTLLAPNCTLALPLTKVALICIMTDSIE